MNKFLKALMCAGLCGSMVLAVACNNTTTPPEGDNPGTPPGGNPPKTQTYNPETRPLYLSIGAVDTNFNPFFYTSLTDGQVVSMTQSSLITTEVIKNSKGDDEVIPVAGDKYPTIAKDFTIRYFRPDGTETNNSADAGVTTNGKSGHTEYEFLIKKGMKYSNGSDITIKDVLFNFYVYLDPSYTGSNTMYSVDIKGLVAFQENDATLGDEASSQSELDQSKAQERVQKIVDWSQHKNDVTDDDIKDDLAEVKKLFREELNSDWTSNATSWSTNYATNYSFQYTWQAFLFMEGDIVIQQEKDEAGRVYDIRVDENGNKLDPSTEEYKNGKNLTTLDPWHDDCKVLSNGNTPDRNVDVGAYDIIEAIEKAVGNATPGSAEYDDLTKEYCINRLYDNYVGDSARDNVWMVVTMWGTAGTAYNYFVADEHGKRTSSSSKPRYYIEGLQTKKVTTFNGKDLGEEYDVLKIVVNKVDPAAIWQFGVSIAPLYYYSGTWTNPKTGVTKNYVESFNGDLNGGKGIIEEGREKETCFGLEKDNITFITDVLKETNKSGVPKGAGAYMAADDKGNEAKSRSEFNDANVINYVRNPNFHTMGAEIENAKIKTLRYRVLEEDKIIANLNSGAIDYGEPNATPTNMNTITTGTAKDTLGYESYRTNGYGYVGINAGKVPDYRVRYIIMSVMNTSDALRYYGANLATTIYRSMSATSWAYPSDAKSLPNFIFEASKKSDPEEIKAYLLGTGDYKMSNGVLTNVKTNETLTYTFTIAGANSDHPAYTMFRKAEEILNKAGFKIKVSTDPNALIELTRGGLQVWAAAWSAGVDPDMYQVWHKDSNATSVKNWGYDKIKQGQSDKYAFEWGIIQDLSDLIEEARSTDDKNERAAIYKQCLDKVMQLGVELPIYQRNDLCVYNKKVIDPNSLNQSPNCYNGLINNIWEVNYL